MSVEIGNYLRQARESVGLSLDEVQEKTRIQKSFLEAIEKGDFDKLPSPFYVRTYLRSYANCVKVEPHYILREYRKKEQAERYQTGQFQVSELTQKLNTLEQKTGMHRFGLTGTMPKISQNSRPSIVNRTSLNTALTIAKSTETSTKKLPTIPKRVEEQTSPSKVAASAASTEKQERRFPSLLPSQALTTRTQYSTSREKQEKTQELPVTNKQITTESRTIPSQLNSTRLQKQQTAPQKSLTQSTQFPPSRLSRSTSDSGSFNRAQATQKQIQEEPLTKQNSQNTSTLSRSTRFRSSTSLPTMSTKTNLQENTATSFSTEEDAFVEKRLSSKDTSGNRIVPVVSQEASEVQQLRRSSLHNRPSKPSGGFFSGRVVIAIIVAIILLCVVIWYLMSSNNDTGSDQSNKSVVTQTQTEEKQLPAGGSTSDQNKTTNDESNGSVTKDGKGIYSLSGTDHAVIVMKPNGMSWVQIRTQRTPTNDPKKYLKDVTLTSKDANFKYTYTFTTGSDLYISLGSPDKIAVTINGIPITSTEIIHIMKK